MNNKHKVITKDLDAETDNSYNSEQDEVDSRDDSQKVIFLSKMMQYV